MLHARSGLPRSVVTWVSQMTASVGATLAATMIYAALPKPVPPQAPAPQPELTSGGKFAARALVPLAYDGLDVMPLPHEAPVALPAAVAPARPDPAAGEPAAGATPQWVAWDGGAPLGATAPPLAPERAAHAARPSHAPVRVEARRAVAGPMPRVAAAIPAGTEHAFATRQGEEARGEEEGVTPRILPGILPAVLSGAREVWTFTASTGGSLVTRVVSQIP